MFKGLTLCRLLIQIQHTSLWSSRRVQTAKFFKLVFWFRSATAVLTFTFRFLSSPLFSLFLPHFFFLLVGFILVGRVFRKAFRILGLGERKGRWVVEQDFHGNFQVNVTWLFAFFSGVLDWIVLLLVWFKRSLHSAHVGRQICPWPLELMTSLVSTRRDVDLHGQLWVTQEQMG